MLLIRTVAVTGAAVMLALATGCATGGNQMQTTIYDMHKRIVKLDKDLGDSITKLNETAATLSVRVDEMDQQTRQLNSMMEDNQKRLDEIGRDLSKFKADMYRHLGVTAPGTGPMLAPGQNVTTGVPTIEQPGRTPAGGVVQGQNILTDSAANPVPGSQPVDEVAAAAAPAAGAAAPAAGDPKAVYAQAQRTYANNDFPNAMQQFDAFLKQYPNNADMAPNALFWKAKCLLNMEKYQDSITAFEDLRTKFPNNSKVPFAMHNQAVAYSRLGKNDEAKRLMQAVVDQFPMSPVAEQAKSDLQRLSGQ